MSRTCDICHKNFSCRQNLWRHMKRGHGRSSHKGSGLWTQTVNEQMKKGYGLTSKYNLDERKYDKDDENVAKYTRKRNNESCAVDHSDVDDLEEIRDDSSDGDSNGEDDEESCESEISDENSEEDNYLWENLVRSCKKTGENIFKCLEEEFLFYKWCKNDEVFLQLLKDVERAKENGYSLKDAFNYAVELRKDLIVASVKGCSGDMCNIWCVLSKRIEQPGCKWITGQDCYCDECGGGSLLDCVRYSLQMSHDMRKDDVINELELEVDERSKDKTMNQAVKESIKRHEKEILKKYQEASEFIKGCNIDFPNYDISEAQFAHCCSENE